MKLKLPQVSNKTLGWLAPIFLIGAIMFMSSNKTPMWMDEYAFYRLASEFPNYSSTADWIIKDRPSLMNASIEWDRDDMIKAMTLTYTNPVFPHTPLMPMLMSPIVKGLNKLADNGVIPHIEDEPGMLPQDPNNSADYINLNQAETITKILRGIPILLFLVSLVLIFKMMYKKVGNKAYFFAIPIAGTVRLLTGIYFFYWDAFMMFFFVLTLYLLEMHPNSKWRFLTACMMINTKIFIPFLFLIPLAVKDKKMIWAGFSIVPFWLYTGYATGDLWYLFRHYIDGAYIHNWVYSLYSPTDFLLLLYSLGIPLMLLMTVPLFKYWKKYKVYIATWIVGMLYAWGAGLGMTQISSSIYLGALIFPLVVYEFHIAEKLSRWISPKKKVAVEVK